MSIIKSGDIDGFKKSVVVYIIKGIRMIKELEMWEIGSTNSGQY